jgi:hypothetical protein
MTLDEVKGVLTGPMARKLNCPEPPVVLIVIDPVDLHRDSFATALTVRLLQAAVCDLTSTGRTEMNAMSTNFSIGVRIINIQLRLYMNEIVTPIKR